MATGSDIITAAFNKVGVYAPTTAQNATSLLSLNNMISAWGAEGMQPVVVSESKALTVGTATYTVGTSATWDTARPIKLLNCFLRNSDNYDFPIEVMAAKDYNDIESKTYEGRPEKVYFLPEYPLAKLIFDCEPSEAYTAYCEFLKPITTLTTAGATVSLPPEYLDALVYNLAIANAEDFERKPADSIVFRARELKDAIRAMNASTQPPPEAKFDIAARSPYNINIE